MGNRTTLLALVIATMLAEIAAAQTALSGNWTYQGRLEQGGTPVQGSADVRFSLWDAASGGSEISSARTSTDVAVEDGRFSVNLDFGVEAYDGNERWLQIEVRSPHDPTNTAPFTTLDPRQALTPAPYAVQTRGIFVDSAGRVGLGTTDPRTPLAIQSHPDHPPVGITQAQVGGNATLELTTDDGAQQATRLLIRGGSADANIEFYSGARNNETEMMRIQGGSGNVGIGTDSPDARLHVVAAANTVDRIPVARIRNTRRTASGGFALRLHNGSNGSSVADANSWAGAALWADNNARQGGHGVLATTSNGTAVLGVADSGTAIIGQVIDAGDGGNGFAGRFFGDVQVGGTLSKSGGSFRIDHPLDPKNKYLSHSFVESPDMMNIYNGNVTTDRDGYAVVEMPDWFEALNRDFRYQLTVIGEFAQAIVAEEMQDRAFVVRTDKPNIRVSWQVTGIRQDAWANANRIPLEQDKPSSERGRYLHPRLFGADSSLRIGTDITGNE